VTPTYAYKMKRCGNEYLVVREEVLHGKMEACGNGYQVARKPGGNGYHVTREEVLDGNDGIVIVASFLTEASAERIIRFLRDAHSNGFSWGVISSDAECD